MKTIFLIITFVISCSINCSGQDNQFELIDLEKFSNKYCEDSADFWVELSSNCDYPEECQEITLNDEIEIILVHNRMDKDMTKFYFRESYECTKEVINKIEKVFLEHLDSNAKSFMLRFFIHFDLEPWEKISENSKATHKGLLIDHDTILIKGYIEPVIKEGG